MLVLLNIRFIQIRRELTQAGFGALVLAAIFIFLIYITYYVFQKTPDAYYLAAALLAFCVYMQMNRRDKSFVYVHIRNPYRAIYAEYLILILPFISTSLFSPNWYVFPILISVLWSVPYLKFTFQQRANFKNISNLIKASDFELLGGFRKSFMFLIPLYLLSLGLSWFRIAPLFFLWLINVNIISFYSESEPLNILKEGNYSPHKFLILKIFRHSKYILLLFLPILVINTIFNPEFLLVNLLFTPLQLSLLCYSIFLKYSNYQPNRNPIGNSILLSLVSLGAILPYFLPIPVLLSVLTYRKAINNLKNFLND